MVKLVFEPDRAKLAKEKLIAVYDPACGTGGMLTIAKEHLLGAINPSLDVYLYGQEINEKTYAVAKADMLMKGEDPENIKRENTLSHDLLPGKQFNYMLSNPPFGKDWKNIREEIEAEHARGAAGRSGALGRTMQTAVADQFVEWLMPVVQAIRTSGAATLEAITVVLNQRGIRSARGGRWHASSVANLLARAKRSAATAAF